MEIKYGSPVEVAQGIRRLTCNNPSPLTGPGTNTFLVGDGDVIVIDPGPDDSAHLQAILKAAPRISHICVTHSHLDHSPLAAKLSAASGAQIFGFGPSGAGTSARMADLAQLGGGEGTDWDFAPDVTLVDGAQVGPLTAHHTPGHFGNHMTFELNGTVFCGDLVMGWASTLISPPDGDLTDFIASCQALRARAPRLLLPAHGDAIDDPIQRIDWLITHRAERTTQILDVLSTGSATLPALTKAVYTDLAPHLLPAAQRNVLAHLIDLIGQSRVTSTTPLSAEATFSTS